MHKAITLAIAIAVPVAALALTAGCATSPTGRSQLKFMPAETLQRQGTLAFEALKDKQVVERSPAVNRYVRCVADALTREVGGTWEVVVFDDDSANAFALPGGKIGVNTGLLDIAEDQHQLATVIGHEIGHVLADHANERVSQGTAAQLALLGVQAGLGASADSLQAAEVATDLLLLKPFSRTHESEADVIGQDLMARAGFDPRASVRLWINMREKGGATPPELLSTHPAPDTRIQDLEASMGPALQTFERARASGKIPNC